MNWDFPYSSQRVPILARNAVATSQPLAAQAGLSMLTRGGNAVDAAIATAVTLTVVEPCSNGIGSDAFAILWDGRELVGLNASGRSPKGWTPERFAGPAMPNVGWRSVTVPGAVSAWVALHEGYGRLSFETLFEPAIRYAKEGFLVPPAVARIWANQVERLKDQPGFAETFLPNGRAPRPGELFRSPAQAATLREIAASRGESFYRGELGAAIARAAAQGGAAFDGDDLAAHRCDWVEPIDIGLTASGYRIHELPPNGQGVAALIALAILDYCGVSAMQQDTAGMQHPQIEAIKLAMADVRAHVGDPDGMRVSTEWLLDPDRIEILQQTIMPSAAPAFSPGHDGGTVYLAAADASGMMVSFIQSNYHGFGSGVVVPGTGIALNNRGACFVTTPGHPNRVGPGKRPLNTIIPGFITKDGAPVAAFGVMGGTMQPQGHLQLVSRMLLSYQNPQAAIDAPRWRVEGDEVWIEASMPAEVRQGLAARGHRLRVATPLDFGAAQIIWRLDDGYLSATETRRDGAAVGF